MKKLSVSLTRRDKLLGWIYYPIQLLLLPTVISFIFALIRVPLNEITLNFLYFSANFVIIFTVFFRFFKENAKNFFKKPLRCLGYLGFGYLILCGLSNAVQIFIQIVSPDFANVNDASIGTMVQSNPLLMFIGIVLLVPTAEEFLYRGIFFCQFYNRKPLAAYLITTCVFAAIHVVPYIGQHSPSLLALCFLQYLPAGFALGWVYAKTDSIWVSIGLHTIVNFISFISMVISMR